MSSYVFSNPYLIPGTDAYVKDGVTVVTGDLPSTVISEAVIAGTAVEGEAGSLSDVSASADYVTTGANVDVDFTAFGSTPIDLTGYRINSVRLVNRGAAVVHIICDGYSDAYGLWGFGFPNEEAIVWQGKTFFYNAASGFCDAVTENYKSLILQSEDTNLDVTLTITYALVE